MAGVLNPILAAAAMVLSSLSVIGNSRRLGNGTASCLVRGVTETARDSAKSPPCGPDS
jgi:hypothetical protein